MAVKFNPFTGQLQIDEKGSGGSSYIDGEVATYSDLPLDGTAPLNSAWLVRSASGVWPVSRKQAGIYIRTATAGSSRDADYTYAGTMPDVFSDAVFTLYDDASTTRTGQFNLASITAGQNRVLTWPDGNGTIARTSDIPSTFAASAVTSGVFDNARINFAAPSAIGSTTPSTGAFTTLNATNGTITASAPVLDLAQTWNNATVTFTGLRFNVTPTACDHRSLIFSLEESSTPFFGIQSIIGVPSSQAVRLYGGSRGIRIGARNTSAAGSADFIGIRYQTATFTMLDGTEFGWSTLPYDSAPNLALHRDAADTLAQRRGTNAQTFRLYNTFTSTTNFERLNIIAQSAGSVIIGTEKGSAGGTARGLELRTDNVARINISATGGIGFYGAAASAQPAAVADATDAASTQARLNDLLARLRTIGLIAT